MKISRLLPPALLLLPAVSALAQYNPDLFSAMHWREIGPFRAGRTRALAGVPDQPNVFYIGAVNGGVWKTTDAGQTWQPLFDTQSTGSIGALAVAPSDPNVIYVASGEGLMRPDLSVGNGIYKSTDAGKTWTHLGLRDGQQIPQIAIDPRDPNKLFVAVLGHPYGPNEERGIFRSTDGGQSFQKVLYKDADTGGSDVQIDITNPNVIYSSLWQARQGPWENGAWSGTGGGLFKSVDGGNTWREITGHGLPEGIVQVDIALSPSNSNRVYITVASGQKVGIYRSDDSGANWTVTTDDPRPALRIGGGDVPVPKVDPKNPDVLYICSTVTWRSTDAGKTWTGIRGAPGGDDYQNIWINPNNPQIILLTSDQGGIVSVNGGATWSSWYNQPTAQMFHVALDNAFPYRACGGQQDSGSACVASRGNDGLITFNDWHPAGIEEYGYAAPDPLNPDIVFGGKVTRYDRRTGQIAEVEPKPIRNFRLVRTEPLVFSQADPHTLFFAGSTVWKTADGGQSWTQISQDLARKSWDLPASVGTFSNSPSARPTQRGVVYALAPSPLDVHRLWAGTDDGLIWNTADGGAHWTNVTPPELKPWWKVSTLDASHFDAQTAYAAVNTLRLDDLRPHLFRTRNGGKDWTEINAGIPSGTITNVIREDTRRKGLLFAGTETEVYVSFDDGDHWQSLRLNMGATSVRDLQIKDGDLVAATHGRGYLILDDITPLRQIDAQSASSNAFLYKPQTAIRIRNNMNPPTPWPPEMAFGENPPDGAVIDYSLGAATSGPLALDILDASGTLIRHYASTDPVPAVDPHYPVPLYWARPPQVLSAAPGAHRFLWDMHYPPLTGLPTEPDADQAVPHNTPLVTVSPWVLPGQYTVRLTVGDKVLTQPLTVRMDPRVKTSFADLQAQFRLSKQMYDGIAQASSALNQMTAFQQQVHDRSLQGKEAGTRADYNKQLDAISGTKSGGPGESRFGPADPNPTLTGVRTQMERLHHSLQNADTAPSAQITAACATRSQALQVLIARWNKLQAQQSNTEAALTRTDR